MIFLAYLDSQKTKYSIGYEVKEIIIDISLTSVNILIFVEFI